MDENDKFTFGKYKGMSIKQVLMCDAAYIMWAYTNVSKERFNPTKEVVQKAIKIAHEDLIERRDFRENFTNFDAYDRHGDPMNDD